MVLITGASGFLGGELVKQLVAAGEKVRIIRRAGSDISHLTSLLSFLEIVEADILDVPALELAFIGIEQVYHTAAVIGYDNSYYDTMYKTNIEGTANIVNLSLVNNVKKLVHVSSIAAIGGKPGEVINEDVKWEKNKWTTYYGITKMMAEREVWRGVQEGLEAVIVNPGIIVGTGNDAHKATIRLFNRIAKGKLPFYSTGTNGFVDVEDVARACIELMNSTINAERFILVAETISFRDYFYKIAKVMNAKPPAIRLTPALGKVFIFFDWLISSWSERKRSLTNEILKVSLEPFEYSSKKITDALQFTFIPLDETIQKVARQLQQQPHAFKEETQTILVPDEE